MHAFVSQIDFFIILHDILAEMDDVTELQPVRDAHVPVMKFKFQGISIDLLFASVSLLLVPEVSKDYPFQLCFFLHDVLIPIFLIRYSYDY